jgi:hypothetical protein
MDTNRERRVPTLSRRRLLASGGVGLGTVALAGAGGPAALHLASARQFGGTPAGPPAPVTAVEAGETAADVAARLGYDVEAIYRFVADEVSYEAYDGALRGAKGTLWARAGNSADQAMLLGALLEAAQVRYRYATGALPAAEAEALAALLAPTAEDVRERFAASATAAALNATGLDEVPAESPQLSPEDQARLDEVVALGQEAFERAGQSVNSVSSQIGEALAGAGVELPPLAAPALTALEADQHVWIQVADGPDWIDLDPSVPGLDPGTAVGEAASTFDAAPDAWSHTLTVKVAADEYFAGAVARRDVVTLTTTSQRAVDTSIGVSMAPAESLGGVGLGITQLFTGQMTIFPSIIMGDELIEASQPMLFATDGASTVGVLDEGSPIVGAAEGETIAVWLIVEIASPGAAPVVVERPLLDRLPAADRATGAFTPESVASISVAENVMGEEMLSEFNALTLLQIETARVPSQHILARLKNPSMVGALEMLGFSLPGLRNTLGLERETEAGVWSYPSGPNVTAFTYHAAAPETAAGELRVSADLLHRQRASLPLSDAATEAMPVHPLVLSGVLDAVAEETLLAPETRGETGAPEPSIGRIFTLAAEAGVGITVLSTVGDLSRVTADELSVALMTAALEEGAIVVVPERPVDLDGVPFTGWWVIDPLSGRTWDQLQNGRSFAASRVPGVVRSLRAQDTLAWYARWTAWFNELSLEYQCLAMAIGILVLVVESVIAFSAIPGAAGGGIGGALGGAAGAASIPFIGGC